MLRGVFLLCTLAVVASTVQAEERRIALLVGNSDYSSEVGILENPKNDVAAMKETLQKVGFSGADITVITDTNRRELMGSIRDFAVAAKDLSASDTALFYYSGHGAKAPDRDSTSLIPVDITDVEDDGFWFDTVDLNDDVIRVFQNANSQAAWIVVVDACRNELRLPRKSIGSGDKSFGVIPKSAGMLIAFAADSGQTARDSVSNSSTGPYAQALTEELVVPGRTLVSIFARVRQRVIQSTGGAQEPVFSHRLNSEITLMKVAASRSEEQVAWDFAARLNEPSGYRAYLEIYPDGEFVSLARTNLTTAIDATSSEAFSLEEPIWLKFTPEDWSVAPLEVLLSTAVEGSSTEAVIDAAQTGDARAATLAAWLFQFGLHGTRLDMGRAKKFYEHACDGNQLRACAGLGSLFANSNGVAEDYGRAIILFKQACDGGNMLGCSNLGGMYARGKGVAEDDTRANALFQQACDGGYMTGCSRLGAQYANGEGVAEDNARANALFKQACDGGFEKACDYHAN